MIFLVIFIFILTIKMTKTKSNTLKTKKESEINISDSFPLDYPIGFKYSKPGIFLNIPKPTTIISNT